VMQKIRMKAVVSKSSPYTCTIQIKTTKRLMEILIIIEKSGTGLYGKTKLELSQ